MNTIIMISSSVLTRSIYDTHYYVFRAQRCEHMVISYDYLPFNAEPCQNPIILYLQKGHTHVTPH